MAQPKLRALRSSSKIGPVSKLAQVSDDLGNDQLERVAPAVSRLSDAPAMEKYVSEPSGTEKLLNSLSNSVQAIHSTLNCLTGKVDENISAVSVLKQEINDKIDSYINSGKELRGEIDDLKAHVSLLQAEVSDLKTERTRAKEDKRLLNVIIRGIPEDRNEKMYVIMAEFLCAAGCSFQYAFTNGASIIGRLPKSSGEVSRYARPIKLCLITKQQKSELFGLKENYLKVPKFINVRLANNMNEEELLAYREMKLVYTAAKGLTGVSAKLRGATVIIDERVYRKADFDRLPHGLTAESISTRLTPDGVAFQSHLSPLSNLYNCKLTDQQGRNATSVEHMYMQRMAEMCNASLATRKRIKDEMNPYVLKQLGRSIKRNEEWNRSKNDILKQLMELKFLSHGSLMNKLQAYTRLHFYEATHDLVYGCGFSLAEASQICTESVQNTSNLTGKLLEDIRDKHKPA